MMSLTQLLAVDSSIALVAHSMIVNGSSTGGRMLIWLWVIYRLAAYSRLDEPGESDFETPVMAFVCGGSDSIRICDFGWVPEGCLFTSD